MGAREALRRSERASMRRQLGIRWKVLAVLALPVTLLAVVAGSETLDSLHQVRVAREVGDFADAQDQVTRTITALQRERLASITPSTTQLTSLRAASDRELVALASVLRDGDLGGAVPQVASVIDHVQQINAQVAEQRRTVDAGGSPDRIRSGYSDIIAADVELAGAVGDALADRTLARRFAAVTLLNRAVEAAATAQLVGGTAISTGGATPDQKADLAVALADHARALAAFKSSGSVVEPQVQQQALAAAAAFLELADRLQVSDGQNAITSEVWTAIADDQTEALRRLAHAVAADASTEAQSSAESAGQRAALVAGVAVALVGLMVLLALMQSRRITAPLRRLAEVTTLTREELPAAVEAISVRGAPSAELPTVEQDSEDEVGAVAAAFAEVQDTVLDIARQQAQLRSALAETFVNVARRNQVLLARQLSFIDRLERSEEDPDALQNLFRLDHLATRMRRNAESLLVLAGIDSGRRARSAMPLTDVIRTAISEVEHYERVKLDTGMNPLVVAHLTLPAAHLVAELIENATNFSEPTTPVVVSTHGSPHGVQISVLDKGLGLSPEDLAAANQRLADVDSSVLVPVNTSGVQRLGLYVVARLAARLGARVWLQNAPGGGTVAIVELPGVVFVEGSSPAATGVIHQIDVASVENPPPVILRRPETPVDDVPQPPALPEPFPRPEPLVLPEPVTLTEPPAFPEPPMFPEPPVLPEPLSMPPANAAPEPLALPEPVDAADPGEPAGSVPPLPRRRPAAPLAPSAPFGVAPVEDVAALPVAPPFPVAGYGSQYGAERPAGTADHGFQIPPPPGGYGYELTTGQVPPPAFVVPPPPAEVADVAPPSEPAPQAQQAVPLASTMPVTMDVLPQRQHGGFSLGRFGRRGRLQRSEDDHVDQVAPLLPPVAVSEADWGSRSAQTRSVPSVSSMPSMSSVSSMPSAPAEPVPPAGPSERAELASTALSELSMLASYRPEVGGGSPAALTKRTPAASPAAEVAPSPVVPEMAVAEPDARPRSAEAVRSTMAGFLSGASAGRGLGGISPRQAASPASAAVGSPLSTTGYGTTAPTPQEQM